MATVYYTGGKKLTNKELAAMDAELEAAAKLPKVYDPDCPPITEEQAKEFYPVHFKSWEERARAMAADRKLGGAEKK